MDLAAMIGCTVAELRQRMSGTEYSLWMRYAGWKGLPMRRLELAIARLTQYAGIGLHVMAPTAPLTDVLLDAFPPHDAAPSTDRPVEHDAFADIAME